MAGGLRHGGGGSGRGTARTHRPLGALLGCEVTSSFVTLPVGGRSDGNTAETDLVLLSMKGSCGGRVEPSLPGGAPPSWNARWS
ncbi:hypothetical protein NKH77_46685 [Streptomyces sp. M19]